MTDYIYTDKPMGYQDRKYHAIKCFTCNLLIPSKGAVKQHMGHDVHYINEKGDIDE